MLSSGSIGFKIRLIFGMGMGYIDVYAFWLYVKVLSDLRHLYNAQCTMNISVLWLTRSDCNNYSLSPMLYIGISK